MFISSYLLGAETRACWLSEIVISIPVTFPGRDCWRPKSVFLSKINIIQQHKGISEHQKSSVNTQRARKFCFECQPNIFHGPLSGRIACYLSLRHYNPQTAFQPGTPVKVFKDVAGITDRWLWLQEGHHTCRWCQGGWCSWSFQSRHNAHVSECFPTFVLALPNLGMKVRTQCFLGSPGLLFSEF